MRKTDKPPELARKTKQKGILGEKYSKVEDGEKLATIARKTILHKCTLWRISRENNLKKVNGV